MKYTNIILTVIAVLLLLHLIISIFPIRSATAGSGVQNVKIVDATQGALFNAGPLKVITD
ncbi:MAG: hypothetical protein KKH98_01570 [Spirochaetes bacterium]|nr:hypothetical protein [Spirochaetota bacterium]